MPVSNKPSSNSFIPQCLKNEMLNYFFSTLQFYHSLLTKDVDAPEHA